MFILGLFFKEDEFQSVVDIMVEEKKDERSRQSIIERGQKGFGVGEWKLATGLGVALFDLIENQHMPIKDALTQTGFNRSKYYRLKKLKEKNNSNTNYHLMHHADIRDMRENKRQ